MKLVDSLFYRLETAFEFQRERRFRFSENLGTPVHYVIRRISRWGNAGFFSNWIFVLTHMAYARQHGWIPVVDMRNYRTLYSESGTVDGTKNAWEYYFRQPVGTREAYRSRNFVLSEGISLRTEWKPVRETDETVELVPERAAFLRTIVANHMQLRPELEKSFSGCRSELFGSKRVLGVHWRGTDKRTPPPGHRPTPSMTSVLDAISAAWRRNRYDLVFLASDEIGMADSIRRSLCIPVVETNALRMAVGSATGLHNDRSRPRRPLHRYRLGLEVLRDAWLLARCDGLVHGHSNVVNAVLVLRDEPFTDRILVKTALS